MAVHCLDIRTRTKNGNSNKEEVKWVRFIFDSYENGKTVLDIKKELDKQGVATRRTKSGLWNLHNSEDVKKQNLYRHSFCKS